MESLKSGWAGVREASTCDNACKGVLCALFCVLCWQREQRKRSHSILCI